MSQVFEDYKGIERAKCEELGDGGCLDWSLFMEDSKKALAMKAGDSLIRLGDGELHTLQGKNLRKRPLIPWMKDDLERSIRKASIVGIHNTDYFPQKGKLARHKDWGGSLNNFINDFGVEDEQKINAMLFLYNLGLVGQLVKSKNVLLINSRASKVASLFKDNGGFKKYHDIYPKDVHFVNIPEGITFPYSVCRKEQTIESFYQDVMSQVSGLGRDVLSEVDCVLIGAGIIGKSIAVDINSMCPNSVAIDIGCLFSLYGRRRDRGIFVAPKGRLSWLFNKTY